jgi:hypothetical protein
LLLIAVFLRHDTSQWLPGYTPAAWFYVLGGALEIVLCSLILLTLHGPLISAAMWIGILEGAQVSICRLATKDIDAVHGQNLCDALTGWHVGAIMTGVYLFIVCPAIGKAWRGYFGRRYENVLGITLVVLVAIGGNEISHLVSPWAAILVMAAACCMGLVAYERAS